MDIHLRIVTSILILLVLISLAVALKRRNIVEESHGRAFSKMITEVTLPALIFFSIVRTGLKWDEGMLGHVWGRMDRSTNLASGKRKPLCGDPHLRLWRLFNARFRTYRR